MLRKQKLNPKGFNEDAVLPFELRLKDFEIAIQDVYDFFYDVNRLLLSKGLHRLDDMLRPAAMSGMISDMLTASMAKHARALVENQHFNGHPDLICKASTRTMPSRQARMELRSRAPASAAARSTRTARANNGCASLSMPRIM